MTKGRKAVPSSANEGIWFRHRGEPGDLEGRFRDATSTRTMLEAPFSAPAKPRAPPPVFQHRDQSIYDSVNPFTQHDNRHYFQDHGVYLGDGKDTRTLGRRLHQIDRRLHHTDESFLHHHSRRPTLHDYNPITATSYRDPGNTERITRRRFPRLYSDSQSEKNLRTTDHVTWHASAHETPMRVLAVSQEPFLAHNSWKYSYKGLPKVYPQYNRKPSPRVDNVLNRYGPNFMTTAGVEMKE